MHQDDVIPIASGIPQSPKSIADRMLIAITTLEYPFELGDIKLVGVRLQHHFPSL